MDLEAWLSPVSETEPCGPNLEYDPDFLALEEAAKETPDQEFGGADGGAVHRIEGSGPEWPEVRQRAEALLVRSKDLRVAIHLTRALIATEGYVGITVGTQLIHGLLERYWDGIHPELDADDNNDPTMRINALTPLTSSDAVLKDIRLAWIFRSRQHGQLIVRDIEVAAGKIPAPSNSTPLSDAQISALLGIALSEKPDLADLAEQAQANVKNVGTLLNDRVGSSQSIDLKPLLSPLYLVATTLRSAAPQESEPESESAADASSEGQASAPGQAQSRSGEIRSREDVIKTLDRICEYLARTEPTNPVPILLKRAQRLMNMSFLEILDDIAPDGLTQAETVVGEHLQKNDN